MRILVLAAVLAGCASTTASSESSTSDPEVVTIPTPVQPPPLQLTLADLSGVVNGRWVTKTTAVGGAVEASALTQLSEGGVKRIVNLRSSGELSGDEAGLSEAAGLEFVHMPVSGVADFTSEFLQEFERVLSDDRATLFHCASGNRVGAAFALHAQAHRGATLEEALEIGRRHGLTSLESAVRSRLEQSP